MACSRGLFIAKLIEIPEWKLELTPEVYFKEQDIKGALEYKKDLIATCIDMDMNVYLIDRK